MRIDSSSVKYRRKRKGYMHITGEQQVFEPKPPVHVGKAPGLPESKCNHLRDILIYLVGVGSVYAILSWILSLTVDYPFSIRRVLLFVLGFGIAKGVTTYLDHRKDCR